MEHAKKMILVDPRMLENLQQRKPSTPAVPDGAVDSAREIERQMADILSEPDAAHQADTYHQLLRRYLNRLDQIRHRPLGTVELARNPLNRASADTREGEETDRVTQAVLTSLPKTLQTKAKALLTQIKNNPDVTWNEKGNLIYQQNLVPGSNMVDLVNDVLRQRKTAADPAGWEVFADVLKEDNTPRELIGNPQRRRWMQRTDADSPKLKKKKRQRSPSTAWLDFKP